MLIEGNDEIRAIMLSPTDNTATVLESFSAGEEVPVKTDTGYILVKLKDSIDSGHKLAVQFIPKGGFVLKYGQQIGRAVEDIQRGAWVHVHNVESLRGRGDLAVKGEEK
ncbi:MAG: UxaA family hydrolase [bacterium]